MDKELNGLHTVIDDTTGNRLSFFDYMMWCIKFREEEKIKKQVRKKAVQSVEESKG